MDLDLSLRTGGGLATGLVYQFVQGVWPGPLGSAATMSEAAFDFVLPVIGRAWPDWPDLAKYGVTTITPRLCSDLVVELRRSADQLDETRSPPEWAGYSDRYTQEDVRRYLDEKPQHVDDLVALFRDLADWLEAQMAAGIALSFCGI